MNQYVDPICFGAFFVSTVLILRRAKYSWVASLLAGLASSLVYIVLYAAIGFPLSMFIGYLHIPLEDLPESVVSLTVSIISVAVWIAGGLYLTRPKPVAAVEVS